MANRRILYKLLPLLQNAKVADASDIELDAAAFSGQLNPSITDVQALATQVDNIVVTPGGANPNRFGGPIVPFTSPVTVDASNYDTYVDAIALYVNSADALVAFNLPSTSVINGRYPVSISILHQGGTSRDAGTTLNPLNRVRVPDPAGGSGDLLRRAPGNVRLQFQDVRQNDFVTFTRQTEADPWVAHISTLTTGSLLLPDGLFNLKPETVRFPPSLTFITGIPTGFTPQAGDAYRVGQDDATFGGYGVQVDDVIVALVDNPSRLRSADNDDWLLIRNATNSAISLQELRFLSTISEQDSFSDSRLAARSDVQNVRVFLATGILDHAPFINPSTDSDNPQDSNGASYVGGDEKDGSTFEFQDTSNHPTALLYVDIDGSFDIATEISNVFVVVKDREGAEVTRLSLEDDFRTLVLSGSTDTYYVYDTIGAADNFSSINYINGYTIDVVHRDTIRQFNLNSQVNVLPAIANGSLPLEKLEPNAQGLIRSDHSLSSDQEAKLNGLSTTSNPTKWTAGDLYVRLGTDTSAVNDLSSFHNVGQQNGMLGQFDSTTPVTFLVPKFVTVTGLERTDDNSVKVSVTPIGVILGRQAFTATLPASTFDINNPVGDAWQVDGMASNAVLTGANSTFKLERSNLSDALASWIQSLQPAAPSPYTLPDNLQQFSRHLQVTTDSTSGWTIVEPTPLRADLARQFAALWDENRRTFTGNYFQDISGVDVVGFQGNNIFYYPSPTDAQNRIFQGAQSYILNSNVRIRNTAGGSEPITEDFTKIISFNYAIDFARIADDANLSMLRVGPTASTPLIGISGEEGLFLNIGEGDGGQRTRTYNVRMDVIDGHWHDQIDETELAEAEIEIPQNLSGALTIEVSIQLDNNGNNEGVHTETITISNVSADQNLGSRDFTYTNIDGLGDNDVRTVNFVYDAVNNDLSSPRRVLFLRPPQPFTNAALTYNVSAVRHATETWNAPTTYAREPINVGNAHDDFGLFDPHLWETEQLDHRNRVLLAVSQYREGDTDSDPEMAVRVIVDGELHGSGDLIRLHRPASDFTFDDMSFGNNNVAIAHIQVYDYDGPVPSGPELQRLYAQQANWLGAFYPPGHAVDNVVIDANMELTADHLFIAQSPNGTRFAIEIDNDGNVTATEL